MENINLVESLGIIIIIGICVTLLILMIKSIDYSKIKKVFMFFAAILIYFNITNAIQTSRYQHLEKKPYASCNMHTVFDTSTGKFYTIREELNKFEVVSENRSSWLDILP